MSVKEFPIHATKAPFLSFAERNPTPASIGGVGFLSGMRPADWPRGQEGVRFAFWEALRRVGVSTHPGGHPLPLKTLTGRPGGPSGGIYSSQHNLPLTG